MKLSPADIQSEFDREGGSRSPIQISGSERLQKKSFSDFCKKNAGNIR